MGNTSFRLVPKIEGNKIGIFLVVPSMGQSRQVAYLEVPDDCQLMTIWNLPMRYVPHTENGCGKVSEYKKAVAYRVAVFFMCTFMEKING